MTSTLYDEAKAIRPDVYRDVTPAELADLREAITDPVVFCERILGVHLWSKQQEIMRSVWQNKRTAVRSCNGAGKTMSAAAAAITYLATTPHSTVVTTAPTGRQVEHLLWREIRRRYQTARTPIGGRCLTTKLELEADWFAIGYSARDTEPEAFQGFHSEHILFIVDEASGVAQPIFEAIEGSLTGDHTRLLLIGNPTQPSGEFHDAFTRSRALYNTIHISAYDTPNFTGEPVPRDAAAALVTPSWVEEHLRKWGGVESPLAQVRILGEFPGQGDDTVVSLASVEAAQERESVAGEPRIVSCDVARFGSDETVIAARHGSVVRIRDAYTGRDLMETVGRVLRVVDAENADRVIVDDAGLGGGVVDRLREVRPTLHIEAFNGGNTADEADEYPNRRSEAWFLFAEQIDTVDLDDDEQLAADLTAPRYKIDSRGRRVVESKDDTKRRLGRSPDRADAVLMAYAARPPAVASYARPRPRAIPRSLAAARNH